MRTVCRLTEPDSAPVEIKTVATLRDWRKIREALNEGKEGFYGPAYCLVTSIDDVIEKAEREFTHNTDA